MDESWKKFEGDFNAMSDAEIEQECASCRDQISDLEEWLEAVVAWEAAGKPRSWPHINTAEDTDHG